MKFIAQFLLIIVATYFALTVLPWWSMVIVAVIAGFIFAFESGRKSFYTGFLAILISWIVLALFADTLNDGIFSAKMASVLNGFAKPVLIILPAILGGIIAGFGSLTGNLLRKGICKK